MGRKTTARDVAAAAGVSASTVDRVLNNRGSVTEEKVQAVLAAAHRLGLDRALSQRPARTLRIAVLVQPPENPFHAEIQSGFEAANRAYPRFNMQFRIHHIDPDRSDRIARQITDLVPQHDGIVIVSAYDGEIAAALTRFSDAGKPVVTLATDMRGIGPHLYVGPDNHKAGRVAGDLMGRFLGAEGGEVIAIAGLMSMIGHRERVEGFREVLTERYPQTRVSDVLESRECRELAGDLVFQAIKRNPKARGIYNASTGAQPIIASLTALRRQEDIVYVTHELTSERRGLLRAGLVDAIIDQDPAQEVRTTVKTMAALFGRAEAFPASLITPLHIHTIENC